MTVLSPQKTQSGSKDVPWRHHFFNWLSLFGSVLFILGAVAAAFLFGLNSFGLGLIAYVDIVYLLFAFVGAIGIILFFAGFFRARHRSKKGTGSAGFSLFTLDLNQARQRHLALFAIGVGVVGFSGISVGTYQATGYMESQEFCAEACHSVMHPEGITYKSSPHAEVKCVDCHVGEGVTPLVASKLNGLRQLWGVTTGNYSRPVPTPVHNMRPARDTCENCHSRDRFIGSKELSRTYYKGDEENTAHKIRMLINVGGKPRGSEKGFGIHYHMLNGHEVEFIARDAKKQEIAWVRRAGAGGGRDVEYNHAKKPLTAGERASLKVHKMECLDCHSRPAHQFVDPMTLVNEALEGETISSALPYVKLEAVRALSGDYATTDEARAGIAKLLTEYYQNEQPAAAKEMKAEISAAITAVQGIYERNIFPSMKVNWSTYPDNIGHKEWNGCFRCHSDTMEDAEGETAELACNSCHVILSQGEGDVVEKVDFAQGRAFVHPEDMEEISEHTDCTECHTGGIDTYD